MTTPNRPDDTFITVEVTPHSVEDTGEASGDKLDTLIAIAAQVKHELNRRTVAILALVGIPIFVALAIGGFLLFKLNQSTDNNQKIAEQAYNQALVNNRDVLSYRRDFAETRDCAVLYLRELLEVSRLRGDLYAVQPPCEKADIEAIDRQLAAVEAKIESGRL